MSPKIMVRELSQRRQRILCSTLLAVGTLTAAVSLLATGARLQRPALAGELETLAAVPAQVVHQSGWLAFTPVPIPAPRQSTTASGLGFTPVPIPLPRTH